MKYFNGIPVGDGILPEKKSRKTTNKECYTIFMTWEQLQKKWNKGKEDKQ